MSDTRRVLQTMVSQVQHEANLQLMAKDEELEELKRKVEVAERKQTLYETKFAGIVNGKTEISSHESLHENKGVDRGEESRPRHA